jgi:hypothetical protein
MGYSKKGKTSAKKGKHLQTGKQDVKSFQNRKSTVTRDEGKAYQQLASKWYGKKEQPETDAPGVYHRRVTIGNM